MPLRDDLLTPIPGDNPSGMSLRYDPVYDQLKEARREEEDLAQGAWKHERKVADHPFVIKTCQEAIATRSKDLQLAAWLTESLLKQEGFGGLAAGLELCHGLLETFWETVYPEIEEGDEEFRAMPLEWLNLSLETPLRMSPLNNEGHNWFDYQDSRNVVGYEESAQTKDAKSRRTKLIESGKLAPEAFDKAFESTPKAFYAEAEQHLDRALAAAQALDAFCEEKFTDEPPTFGKVEAAIKDVRHLVHTLLQKKREVEPDPVTESPAEEPGAPGDAPLAAAVSTAPAGSGLTITLAAAEPPARQEAVASVVRAAAQLRALEPGSPAPYLMLRGLRWGELREALASGRFDLLEGPPTDLRQHIKRLAIDSRWDELINAAEEAMSLPCSRGWLDMQRLVVEALAAKGNDYDLIAKAIRCELRALLRDVPEIMNTTLLDDTPAANPETRTWLRQLIAEPEKTSEPGDGAEAQPGEPVTEEFAVIGWKRTFIDPVQRAREAFEGGNKLEALEILQKEVERQRSGRGRFLKKLQMAELCVKNGMESIAQPILEELLSSIDDFKLEAWEDREVVARALVIITQAHEGVKDDAKEKKKFFKRICRLDPARALEC